MDWIELDWLAWIKLDWLDWIELDLAGLGCFGLVGLINIGKISFSWTDCTSCKKHIRKWEYNKQKTPLVFFS